VVIIIIIMFFIYLCAELNSQWAITAARIQTAAICITAQNETTKTKKN
jgi:hypothetical protein